MPEIARYGFGLVEPAMERQVIGNLAAPFIHGGKGVMVGMRHDRLAQNSWVKVWVSV
jgi:hypothetical protein